MPRKGLRKPLDQSQRNPDGTLKASHYKLGGVKKISPEELLLRFETVEGALRANREPLIVQTILRDIGLSKSAFYANYKDDPAYEEVIDRIYQCIEAYVCEYGMTGKAAAFVIFYLKNTFGWRDDRGLAIGGMEGGAPIVVKSDYGTPADFVKGVETEIEYSDEEG